MERLAPSRSKEELFRVLGWSESNEHHKRLYAMMMQEAAEGRRRTFDDPANLTVQTQTDPRVRLPYTSAQITETAKHREIINIYNGASSETRRVYDVGTYWEGPNWENWIIRWCLWHVFRYRDERNKHRSRQYAMNKRLQQHQQHHHSLNLHTHNHRQNEMQEISVDQGPIRDTHIKSYYDPVRDILNPSGNAPAAAPASIASAQRS